MTDEKDPNTPKDSQSEGTTGPDVEGSVVSSQDDAQGTSEESTQESASSSSGSPQKTSGGLNEESKPPSLEPLSGEISTNMEKPESKAADLTKESSSPGSSSEIPSKTVPKSSDDKHVSQAVKDLREMKDEDYQETLDKEGSPPKSESPVSDLFWQFFLIVSEIFLALWVAGTFLGNAPYELTGLLLVIIVGILSFPSFHFLKNPTKAGLAFMGMGLAFAITAFHDPDVKLIFYLPLALIWAIILVCYWFFVAISVWKIFGVQKKKSFTILLLLLLYPGIGLFATFHGAFGQTDPFNLSYVIDSPKVLSLLPWFIKPIFFSAVMLPLAAAFLFFRYEFRVFSSPGPGGRHHAGFFLALASIFLFIYGYFGITHNVSYLTGFNQSIKNILVPHGSFLWRADEEQRPIQVSAPPAAPPQGAAETSNPPPAEGVVEPTVPEEIPPETVPPEEIFEDTSSDNFVPSPPVGDGAQTSSPSSPPTGDGAQTSSPPTAPTGDGTEPPSPPAGDGVEPSSEPLESTGSSPEPSSEPISESGSEPSGEPSPEPSPESSPLSGAEPSPDPSGDVAPELSQTSPGSIPAEEGAPVVNTAPLTTSPQASGSGA
ncbi:MAG: hypothetical protein LBF22_05935, partial [Deltaproteobacteria bacterium]|nr:hypothetical protein [Deltaproteobacteria bacterium]